MHLRRIPQSPHPGPASGPQHPASMVYWQDPGTWFPPLTSRPHPKGGTGLGVVPPCIAGSCLLPLIWGRDAGGGPLALRAAHRSDLTPGGAGTGAAGGEGDGVLRKLKLGRGRPDDTGGSGGSWTTGGWGRGLSGARLCLPPAGPGFRFSTGQGVVGRSPRTLAPAGLCLEGWAPEPSLAHV